jgi:ABC-type lipoprotein release transport system permease subunit
VRTTRAGLALLIAVLALSAGVAMAAVAGARRSDSAYPRFLEWATTPELGASGCRDLTASTPTTIVECDDAQTAQALVRLRELPFLQDSVSFGFADVVPELPDGDRPSFLAFLPAVDYEGRLLRVLPRVKMIDGRSPNPSATHEAAIGSFAAERFHLSVGDQLRLYRYEDERLVDTVRLVGIYVAPGELPSASGPGGSSLVLTRAFGRIHRDVVATQNDGMLLRLRPGTSPQDAATTIRALGFDVNETASTTSGIERTIHFETVALLLLAIVVAGVGLVVVGQMLRRQTAAESGDGLMFWALGCDRGDALRLGLLRGLLGGCAGAGLAVVVAIAVSPLFPVGIGRVADPDVGLHADALVLLVGASLAVFAVVVLAVCVGLYDARSSGRHNNRTSEAGRPWPLPTTTRPPLLVGLYFALPRRAGARTQQARISLVSLVVVVVILAATAVTLASFDHLVGRRDLSGATWHAAILPATVEQAMDNAAGAREIVSKVPGVAAATVGTWAATGGGSADWLYVNGQRVGAQVFGDGPIRPAIARGHPPERAGEIALGPKTLAMLGARLGDYVELSLDPTLPSTQARVVGESVLVSPYFFDFAPGTGAAITMSAFTDLGGIVHPTGTPVLVRFANGADDLHTFNAIERALGSYQAFQTADRHSVTGLGRIRLVPVLLLIGLMALVAAAVAHVLLVSVAGHRRDVAVLRAMGFTRPQSWTSVTVQGTVIALAACLVGIPLGVVLGRAAWNRIAASLIVVPRPMAPLALLGLIALVLVAVAVIAAVVPSARAVRLKPAAVLRAD